MKYKEVLLKSKVESRSVNSIEERIVNSSYITYNTSHSYYGTKSHLTINSNGNIGIGGTSTPNTIINIVPSVSMNMNISININDRRKESIFR